MRTQKVYEQDVTNYYYNGSVLIGMTAGSISQRFSYDSSGRLVAVDYSTNNGSSFTTYYYLRNAQGDIINLLDNAGTTVVQYAYDTWGRQTSCTGTLATTLGQNQPFRYRGYVYDAETGWYYLQSRYYNPETCRFISSDVLLSTGQGVLGHNAYAYCLNNPIKYSDSSGTICYVFYLPEWKNQALNDRKELMERYGFDESEVILIEVTSDVDFTDGWNSIGIDAAATP